MFKLKLRNINVDYDNTTKEITMNAKYFSLDSFYYGTYLSFINENGAKGAISVSQTEDTAY